MPAGARRFQTSDRRHRFRIQLAIAFSRRRTERPARRHAAPVNPAGSASCMVVKKNFLVNQKYGQANGLVSRMSQ